MLHFYLLIVIASLDFFLTLLKYRQNNEIRATRSTTLVMIVNILMDKKDE